MSKYYKSMSMVVNKMNTPQAFKLSGPAKISLKDRCAFSIPAGPEFGCPGATEACDECYAQKKRHLWNPVQKVMAANWQLLKEFEQNEQTDEAAQAILRSMRKDLKVFRLYESGDFHSQWVINVWAKVIKEKRDVSFWAYTRSFHLNFTNLTKNKNFTLWASTDTFNTKEAKQFVRRFRKSGVKHAYGPWDHNTDIPKSSFVCPVTNNSMQLFGACEKCSLCVVKNRTNKHVVFLKH